VPGAHQEQLLARYEGSVRAQVCGMLSQIELEIITACNLRCFNCDRSSRQAVSAEAMQVRQVAQFVDESLDLEWRWRKIALLGGEPTLHPQLDKIIHELERYRARFPGTLFQLVSNGYGELVNDRLAQLPAWFCVRNTRKRSVEQPFDAYNIAPIDLEEYETADFSRGCSIPFLCGMALTRYGFYACGAGASVDRVFGIGCAVHTLRLVTPERLMAKFHTLCRYCGHFHGRKTRAETMSRSWTAAYARWHDNRPALDLYALAPDQPSHRRDPIGDE
jgi:hypothetical protein